MTISPQMAENAKKNLISFAKNAKKSLQIIIIILKKIRIFAVRINFISLMRVELSRARGGSACFK